VLDEIHPLVAGAERVLDLREGYVLRELQGEGLAVGAHGADAHAHAVDGHLRVQAEDLVRLDLPLPLLAGLATVDGAVDPWDEAAGERRAELTLWEGLAPHQVDHLAIELEDAGARIGGCWRGAEHGHLTDELTHVAGAGPRGGLVGDRVDPLDPAPLEQGSDGHEHQAHGAVAADEIALARGDRLVDASTIDG